MRLSAQVIVLVDAYAVAAGVSETTASKRATGTATTIKRLRDGSAITDHRFERIRQWFFDNWPPDAPWPDAVARPADGSSPTAGAAAAAPAPSCEEAA